MATVFKASAFGDTSVPFDTEPSAYNPVVTWGMQGGEPAIVVTPTGQNFFGKSPIGSPAALSFRFSITPSAFPTASNPIFAPLTSGGSSAWRIRLSSTGTLIFDNPSNAATVTTPAMTAGNTYTLKVRITATTLQVRMYNGVRGGSQVGSDMSATNTYGLADNIRIGQALATPVVPAYRLQHLLFTDTDEWLPDSAAPSTVTGKVFGIIGDSLTAMSGANGEYVRQELLAKGILPRNVYFWGVGGKRLTIPDTAGSNNGNANAKTTMQNIQDAKNVYGTIDHWIVALGTNDRPQTDADVNGYIDTVLAAIGTAAKVTWIGLTSKATASADDIRVNNLIKAKLTARGNATFADWDAHIRAIDGGANPSPYWLTTDTTHMTPLGYQERASFYAAQLADNTPVKVTAAGSLALTGSASRTVRLARTASGTFALNGAAQTVTRVARTAQGTLTVTGTAEHVVRVTRTATASLTLTGTASTSGATERTADGTLTLTGTATTAVRVARTAHGTLALGGIGTVTFHVVRTALGILTLTGQGTVRGETPEWPDVLTLTAAMPELELTADVPQLTLEATW